jgi:hypothetical protein
MDRRGLREEGPEGRRQTVAGGGLANSMSSKAMKKG